MPTLRSSTTTSGPTTSGARALWRATGMTDRDFGRPIVAIANSFSEFVPGHVHLREVAPVIAEAVRAAGGVPREFNTIAVDDGIAMGHDGMLYSLPSRDLIADAVEYVVEAHCADALVCLSNCDKITPGMLMAAMRLNVPTVFVSGGPMEAGRPVPGVTSTKVDLISAVAAGGDSSMGDAARAAVEEAACPTCGSCSGMFTANSMNCLTEALGLALPGNGTLLATHADRRALFADAGRTVVELARRWYDGDDETALPRSIAAGSVRNAVALDIAMGGSTNTVLHLMAAAHEADLDVDLDLFDAVSRRVPVLCKVAPSSDRFHIEDVHRAGGIPRIMGELARAGLIDTDVATVTGDTLAENLARWDLAASTVTDEVRTFWAAAPGGVRTTRPFSQERRFAATDLDAVHGCVRSVDHAWSADGGLAVLRGRLAPDGCVVKSAGVPHHLRRFRGPARVFESEDAVVAAILDDRVTPGDCLIVRHEGPRGGPGMQEMLHPTSFLKAKGLDDSCALVTDGRFSGGSAGLAVGHVSPEAAAGGVVGLVADGDEIVIDVDARRIDLGVTDAELSDRRDREAARGPEAWTPTEPRPRRVSTALRAYASFASSAARGAVRLLPDNRPAS